MGTSPVKSLLLPLVQAPTWSVGPDEPARLSDLEVIFARVIRIAVQLAGVALFVMLIVAGFKLLTAQGDAQQAAQARQTMTYAIIGLVVIATSWLLLKILGDFFGISLLEFEIKTFQP